MNYFLFTVKINFDENKYNLKYEFRWKYATFQFI